MMNIKHLLAGSVVTAAVTAALVLGGAATAQATVFPTPTPIGPGSVSKPIYTQPSLPGFHLPAQLWTKYGPQIKPSAPVQFSVLPVACTQAVSVYTLNAFAREGYRFGDSSVHATDDPQLLALLAGHPSISCRWVQPRTGAIIDVTDAIGVNDGAVSERLRQLGFSEPGPTIGFAQDLDGVLSTQYVATRRGGWTLIRVTDNSDLRGILSQDPADTFFGLNNY